MKKAVILLSGGLDSATCLALAKSEGYSCFALSFAYGQRHTTELKAAARVAQSLNATDHKIVQVDSNLFVGSALTTKEIEIPKFKESSLIPITYVPARNTIFLSMALAFAEAIGARAIFIGVSSVDYSHYPDCRPEFIAAFQTLANLATKAGVTGDPFSINAPLQLLNKVETIQLGTRLGIDYSLTVSCYQANALGEACGSCDSCTFRKRGFAGAKVVDPTLYRKD